MATTDDRDPTERTLAALGIADRIDATVCADDGIAVKPAPDMVLHLCAALASTRHGRRSSATRPPTSGWHAPPAPA